MAMYITLPCLYVARTVSEKELWPSGMEEPLSKMMDEFAPETTENVWAEGFPTCLTPGNDFNLWASSLVILPIGRHFLPFLLFLLGDDCSFSF